MSRYFVYTAVAIRLGVATVINHSTPVNLCVDYETYPEAEACPVWHAGLQRGW